MSRRRPDRRTKSRTAWSRTLPHLACLLPMLILPSETLGAVPDLSRAQAYRLVDSGERVIGKDARTARIHALIVAEADSVDEFAQTAMRAALDLHRQFGEDHTEVCLVPSVMCGRSVQCATALYAADSLGSQGLKPWGYPNLRYAWLVTTAERGLTSQELSVAETWQILFPRYHEKGKMAGCDPGPLRAAIADSLGIPLEEAVVPHFNMSFYLVE
jgi:hypothetical protein